VSNNRVSKALKLMGVVETESTKSRRSITPRSPANRSRVTNGRILRGIDGRSAEARRLRDVFDALILQYDISDESDLCLARRAATLVVWAEDQDARLARGEAVDDERLIRSSNTIRRIRRDLAASAKAHSRAARRNTR
jgi:hypothetical protein